MTSKAIFKKENHESNYGGGILDENLIHETSLKLRRSPPTVTGQMRNILLFLFAAVRRRILFFQGISSSLVTVDW